MSDNQNAVANIEQRLKELKNVHRLISNTLNLICDVDIKGGHAVAVGEILGWLDGFRKSIENQMTTLEATLPKAEEAKPIEAEVVQA